MYPKSVLITGANRGLGFEMVKQILKRYNPDVIFSTYRDANAAKELFKLASENPRIHPIMMDVRNHADFTAVVEQVSKVTGEKGLNLLINNAGVFRYESQSLQSITKEIILEFFEVNTLGALFVTQAFLPLLEKASKFEGSIPPGFGKAAVVNFSSRLGSIEDNKSGGYYASRLTRSATNSVTKSMGIDLEDKSILAVAMNPGWVQTDQGGPQAPLKVEDSVEKILKVLEDLNQSHTGAFLQYDGQAIPW